MSGGERKGDALDLGGVLVPGVTPFDGETGDFDPVSFRANVRHWIEAGVRGIVVGGSTGEAVFLDHAERLATVEAARGVVPEDRLLVAGTGLESTRGTIALTREVAERGADAVLVQPPAFYRGAMTPAVLRDHYRALADAAPIPVILYQVPLRMSTVEFPAGLVQELARHPNIIGMKDSRGDMEKLGELVRQVSSDFQLLVGNGARLFAALEIGAVGGILGVANLVPAECVGIVEAFRAEDHARAGALQGLVGPLHVGIVGAFGVAGVKHALDGLGLRGGRPRLPLVPLDESGRTKVEGLLSEATGRSGRVGNSGAVGAASPE